MDIFKRAAWKILIFGTSLVLFQQMSYALPSPVNTTLGPIVGGSDRNSNFYLGIPYGKPPLGELRFSAPLTPDPWDGALQTTELKPNCAQPDVKANLKEGTSEDCLYLNVYTPRYPVPENRPVVVWFHGGGLRNGGASSIDASQYVNRGIIAVSVNYRLGYLGFYALEPFSKRSLTGTSGNYGIMDQQLALRWVQDNIQYFGGDPDNVTIAGQSAGALSVQTHLASPTSHCLCSAF